MESKSGWPKASGLGGHLIGARFGAVQGMAVRSCEAVAGGLHRVVSLIQRSPSTLPPQTGFYLISPLELILCSSLYIYI